MTDPSGAGGAVRVPVAREGLQVKRETPKRSQDRRALPPVFTAGLPQASPEKSGSVRGLPVRGIDRSSESKGNGGRNRQLRCADACALHAVVDDGNRANPPDWSQCDSRNSAAHKKDLSLKTGSRSIKQQTIKGFFTEEDANATP